MKLIQTVKNCIRWLTPYGVIMLHRKKWQHNQLKMLAALSKKKKEIKNYFLNLNYSEQEYEITEIIDYFRKHDFSVFPYEFTQNYHAKDVDIFYDELNKTRYVIHENKCLYFPDEWSIIQIQNYYNDLALEQDKDSPHRYETEEFVVKDGDIIADIGAAEGFWTLQNIEKASKAYLFECAPIWITALQKTFEPWKEKVVIVNKYVSDTNIKNCVTLDSFFYKQEINFIKADIEGMELKLLEGSAEILKQNDALKLLLCTYHLENDAVRLKRFLENNGFETEYSKGYMLFSSDIDLREPYIRRGLIRARK